MVLASCNGEEPLHGGTDTHGEFQGERRNCDCQVRESEAGGRRGVGDRWRGAKLGGDEQGFESVRRRGEEGETTGESRGGGGGEEAIGERVYERGDGGRAPNAPTEPTDGATGEAGAHDEARHGEGEHAARELRGGESPLPPELSQGVSPLRIADLSSQRGARDAGESHAATEDDDAESRRLDLRTRIEAQFGHHKPGLARLNNGSFGSCPKSVLAAQAAWSQRWLHQPDECYFGPLEANLLRAREEVANLIRAPVEEVFLLENVTASASMVALDVMWAFAEGRYQKGDAILTLNFTYGAVKNAFKAYAVRAGARMIQVQIPFPVSSSKQILQTFEQVLQKEREDHPSSRIRLAVFDHIISMPTMILPIRALVSLCRRHGVESIFIDGAHGIGNLDLDMIEIDADYYTSNLHKWMFAPTTAAFLHCKAKHLARLHHPIVSHLYGAGVVAECSWVGTRDYSAFVAVPDAIKFVKDVSGSVEEYSEENHCKVVAMAEMLASAWGTFLGTPPEMCAAMAMVALPPALHIHSQAELSTLRRLLREEYQVEVHLFYAEASTPDSVEVFPQGNLKITSFVRISHQIYNKIEEYTKLRDAINEIQANIVSLCVKPAE